MDQPDPEAQLRDFIRHHDAGMLDVLDALKREILEMALTTPSQEEAERILKEAGVDLEQLAAEGRAVVAEAIEEAEGFEARALKAERHLSALRQAAEELATSLAYDKADDAEPTRASRRTWNALTALRELLAAHDAAPAAQGRVERITFKSATPPGVVYTPDAATSGPAAPAAPTLTLEEVAPVLTEVLEEMLPRHFSTARRRQIVALFKRRLAQKGAGNG